MSTEASEKFKSAAIVTFGAYAIGLITRRGWDSVNHFPVVADAPLIDIDLVVYGIMFILNLVWCIITVHTIYEVKLLTRARAAWDNFNIDNNKKGRRFWISLWMLFHLPMAFILLTTVPVLISIALSSGINRGALYMLASWIFMCFCVFAGVHDSIRGVGQEPDTIERILADVTGAEGKWGQRTILVIFIAMIQGLFQYPRIPQAFGGGKPEPVIVFLKQGNNVLLPSQTILNGKLVDMVFKRGSKFGFKAEKWRNDHIVIIDQDSFSRIYAGSGVHELDPSKLSAE